MGGQLSALAEHLREDTQPWSLLTTCRSRELGRQGGCRTVWLSWRQISQASPQGMPCTLSSLQGTACGQGKTAFG